MVNVAISGGNGAIGKTIVEVLDQSNTKHKTFIFSRKAPANERETQVDYKDIDGLVKVLEDNDIHTVICTFGITGDSLGVSQLNLIKAAEKSNKTRRFIPSVFAIEYPREGVEILPPLEHHFTCLDALAESSLEWTIVINGLFLDYFGMPHIQSHLSPNTIAIDVQHKKVRSLGMGMHRSHLCDNLDVTYDPIEKLKRFEVTELPGHVALYDKFPKDRLQWFLSIFELWTTDGTSEVKKEGSLNDRFPQIRPLSVTEFWRRLGEASEDFGAKRFHILL